MTPQEVIDSARAKYNATADSFWQDMELFGLVYDAQLELANETLCIEGTDTATTVIGTRSYAYPSNAIAIKRVEYDGQKLSPMDFREDDEITGNNAATTTTATPQFYAQWAGYIYLRPVPDSALTLTYYIYKQPGVVTASSTLDIPSMFHNYLVNYVVGEMYAKDKDLESASYFKQLWNANKIRVKAWMKHRRRTDMNASVKDGESMARTLLGYV